MNIQKLFRTQCQRHQRPRLHHALFIWGQGKVFCLKKVSENFVGLSQILKEQSGEKLFDVYTHQIAIIKKYENLRM